MKLLYLVTEDGYFFSHRLPMARAAKSAGFDDVAVIANVRNHRRAIEKEGVRVISLPMDRRSLNPFRAVADIVRIVRIYRREQPDLVHHIAMKPVLYGSIAGWLAGVPHTVNAFAGLGYVFTADALLARALRLILVPLFRVFLKRRGSYLLLQNGDDLALMRRLKIAQEGNAGVIPGSGIDLDLCPAQPFSGGEKEVIFVFAGRMIGIKGLQTLKDAFDILRLRTPQIKLWLCGAPDPANPGSWTEDQLRAWAGASGGNVLYKGHCADMRAVWAAAHGAVQPSYGGEGVPKSLLEAAAYARPIVATDVPGCRDMVDEGKNGLIVHPRDPQALARAIEKVALSPPEEKMAMGHASRELVMRKGMGAADIGERTKALYLKLVADEGNQV